MAVKNLQALTKTLLVLMTCGHLATAQNNGDLRLVHGADRSYGRLEIYLDGQWGTFCATGFTSFTGDTACHQLGYDNSIDVGRAVNYTEHIPLASNSTPIHYNGYNECMLRSRDYVMHILRCYPVGFRPYLDPSCTHDNDVILTCSSSPLDSLFDGYDTEIRLNSEAINSRYRSSGVLEIYSSVSQGGDFAGWSNICGTKFDQNAANTACRQMGYTRALSYNTTAQRSRDEDIWLDGVTCGNYSQSCLDSCFCYPQPLTAVQCESDQVVALSCTFDLGETDFVNSAGGRWLCEEIKKTFCAPTPHTTINLIILGSVLSAIVVILFLVIVGLLTKIGYRSGRTGYQTIN